jgi:hypothetical protein
MAACAGRSCDVGTGIFYDAVCGPDAHLQNCGCWAYDGAGAGHVYESPSCDCPFDTDPTWN